MFLYRKIKSSGFTLFEILLVVAIISVLAGIVIVAINPTKQLATAHNTQRRSDVKQIDNAVKQYYIDKGRFPTSTDVSLIEICDTGNLSYPNVSCSPLFDLSILVPTYITAIPKDPKASTANGTGYQISLPTNARGKNAVVAPHTELLTYAIAIGTTTVLAGGGDEPPATYQCNDTIDNDSDGQTDYPDDAGCTSGTDDTEDSDVVSGSEMFTYTGSNQSWVVPGGVTTITVKAWGAGGGGGGPNATERGGGGGFAQGDIAVTPGETLTIIVGGGGTASVSSATPAPATYGGGGRSGPTAGGGNGGAGGGRSAVRRSSTELLTAGGGGGSAYAHSGTRQGGAGGGATGAAGSGGTTPAGGGTQSAGGAAGTGYSPGAGTQYTGGEGDQTAYYTGGGGGGYYGGGGGGARNSNHGSGGGGSGYVGGATNTTNTAGSTYLVANSADTDYPGSVGNGGQAASSGQGGYIYISY